MKTVKQILIDARLLVESGWCQGAFARDRDGEVVDFASPVAAAFCMAGAIHRVTIGEPYTENNERVKAHQLLAHAARNSMLPDWQDAAERSKAEVLSIFDEAIENCPKEWS